MYVQPAKFEVLLGREAAPPGLFQSLERNIKIRELDQRAERIFALVEFTFN
jgi:hypothetical protein